MSSQTGGMAVESRKKMEKFLKIIETIKLRFLQDLFYRLFHTGSSGWKQHFNV